MSIRRPHCRFLGRYSIFRAGFIVFRLYALPSGKFMHVSGRFMAITPSIAPPL
ncbi:MAG: hypothetical protein ACTHMV_06870 [Chitinophagaceae bacterium]